MRRTISRAMIPALLVAACSGSPPDQTGTPADSTSGAGAAVADGVPAGSRPTRPGPDDPSSPEPATPTDPPAPVSTTPPAGGEPDGFELVAARVVEPDGSVCELCLWLADDADRRRRGLMFVTDLGPADGMAFRYPDAHTGSFWMKNTVLPLSIAFYDPAGNHLDSFDMEPCTADPCPNYRTPPGFLIAIETLRGRLPDLGMVPGSTFELLELPCPPG